MTLQIALEEREPEVAAGAAEQHRKRRRSGTKAARPDIQGLRAVAVVLVILDHLGGWPHGVSSASMSSS